MEEAAVAWVSASVAGVLLAQYMFTLKGRNTNCAYSGTHQNFLLDNNNPGKTLPDFFPWFSSS